ncbi:hypothetical protein HDU98_002969, partial [Podochytrium sp. JEL0797]
MDVAGTAMGVDTAKLAANLTALDTTFGLILSAAKAFTSAPCNVVVMSDHGMASVSNTNVIYYEDLFDVSTALVVQNRPMGYVYPNSTFDMAAFKSKSASFSATLTAYIKGESDAPTFTPTSPRIPQILLLPAEGTVLAYRTPGFPFAPKSSGSAGYLNTLPSMQGVFAGYGPAFKSTGGSVSGNAVRTVDVYAVLAKLVGVSPAKGVDAQLSAFDGLLV